MHDPCRVGIIGAGMIADTYIENLQRFADVELVAIGNRTVARAEEKARRHGIPRAGSVESVIDDASIDVVVNLTVPQAHVPVSEQCLRAGKHVWTEKPIGMDVETTRELLRLADSLGLRVGAAPDTLLSRGFLETRRLVADGGIGTPLFAQFAFQTPGPDLWHPDPAFLFQRGAGPVLDMGPYYLTALVHLLGPVRSVVAAGSCPQPTRRIHAGERAGETFEVEVPTTVQVLCQFDGGAHASGTFSFDCQLERHGFMELHGSSGSVRVPDPNRFDGSPSLLETTEGADGKQQRWTGGEHRTPAAERGLGVLDMVRAIAQQRPHVTSSEIALHVLEVLVAIEDSARDGRPREIGSRPEGAYRVEPDWDPFARTC